MRFIFEKKELKSTRKVVKAGSRVGVTDWLTDCLDWLLSTSWLMMRLVRPDDRTTNNTRDLRVMRTSGQCQCSVRSWMIVRRGWEGERVMVIWWETSSADRLSPAVRMMSWRRERQVWPGQSSPPRYFNSSRESLTTTGTTGTTDTGLEVEVESHWEPSNLVFSWRRSQYKSAPLLKDVGDWYWFMIVRLTNNRIGLLSLSSQLDG